MKKLSIIRTVNIRACPFGLPIAIACHNAGESVKRMEPLESVPKEQRERYKKSNRRVYRHHKENLRCPYADKIVEGKDIVNCDFGDTGEGINDFPLRPSPFYPRVFSGLGQSGMFSYPLSNYSDNSGAQQLFDGIFYMYANSGEIPLMKASNFKTDYHLINTYTESKSLKADLED